MSTVSARLLEEYNLSMRPGTKGECPFCKRETFSLKPDDTLGKCFHPACARYLTAAQGRNARASLSRVLEPLYQECHQALLGLAMTPGDHAYAYLRDERGVHPQVIEDAMLGMVPSGGCDIPTAFQPVLADAQAAVEALQGKRGRPTKQLQQADKRLQDLKDAQEKLHNCLAHKAGWLMFFYTDAAHRPVALRLRQPYTHDFVSFKPGLAGVFGRELFTPYVSPERQAANDFLLITEGEFNVLQLQSLTVRYGETTGQALGYLNACAVGGVLVADTTTLQRVTSHPVIVYDHDAHGAGFELVKRLQQHMPVEACTTAKVDSDLDELIADLCHDPVAAWRAVEALIATRTPYGRIYSETGKEFFDLSVEGEYVFTPKLLGDALLARQTYRYAASQLWVYRDGVYLPCGETTLRGDAQTLLGKERRERRVEEAFKYVEVARRIEEEDGPPDCQSINLRNGRLDWAAGTLEKHTSERFTTTQLPVEYDAEARCEAFDTYLQTTFDADVHPLITELLGWCLIPDTRFETAIMLTGGGSNGKSVFLDLVSALLGEANVSNVALQDLEENRFRVAELYGKLANTFADLDTRALMSSSMFKMLTTGDRLSAERKFGQPFHFRSYAKLLFSANKIPASRDRTYAFYRRWVIIPFTRTFDGKDGNPTPDTGLRETLRGELPGILNLALQGLARLRTNKRFTEPSSVVEAKKKYIRSNDNVAEFVEQCVIPERDATIVKQTFYEVYERWCKRDGVRAVSQKALKGALTILIPLLDEWREGPYAPWQWLGMAWGPDAAPYLADEEPEEEESGEKKPAKKKP